MSEPTGSSGATGRGRAGVRRVLLAVIAVLYLISIPWYRTPGAEVGLAFGLPDWVAVSLACYIGVALLNSIAWLLTDVPDVSDDPESRHDDA